MRRNAQWSGALVTAALWTAAALTGCAGSKPAPRSAAIQRAAHPEVDADLDGCASCHAQVTPQIAAQWSDSRHGMALVKCFVCHGSTGADFAARPAPTSCRSCHPDEWRSVTRDATTQGCFGCHPPHALRAAGSLSPHASSATKEVAR